MYIIYLNIGYVEGHACIKCTLKGIISGQQTEKKFYYLEESYDHIRRQKIL